MPIFYNISWLISNSDTQTHVETNSGFFPMPHKQHLTYNLLYSYWLFFDLPWSLFLCSTLFCFCQMAWIGGSHHWSSSFINANYVNAVYRSVEQYHSMPPPNFFPSCAILTPTNEDIWKLNIVILSRFPGSTITFSSADLFFFNCPSRKQNDLDVKLSCRVPNE